MSTEQPYRHDDVDDDVSGDLTSAFLKQSDFSDGESVLFTITHVDKRHFEARNGRPAGDRWVVSFEGTPERCLGLNQTNLALLAKWFGRRHRAWAGQQVVVYRDESVSFGGRLVGGLRVRKPSAHELAADDAVPFDQTELPAAVVKPPRKRKEL
jgi:hypothetical protein